MTNRKTGRALASGGPHAGPSGRMFDRPAAETLYAKTYSALRGALGQDVLEEEGICDRIPENFDDAEAAECVRFAFHYAVGMTADGERTVLRKLNDREMSLWKRLRRA